MTEDQRFWQEIINEIPTFGVLSSHNLPKVGIKLLLIISCQNLYVKNLIPCFLAFGALMNTSIPSPYLPHLKI